KSSVHASHTLIAPAHMKDPEKPLPRLTQATLQGENEGLDKFLALFVLIFAFLVASFPIDNNDVWFQLRTGQMIADGTFVFGQDPFSYTTDGTWHHVAWLWDLVTYSIHAIAGGVGLAVFRSLIVLAIALILLATRRRQGSLFVAAACVALGILVLS